MNATSPKRLRCAVYTRKSTEEGLEMAYTSIDAQRDSGAAYIASRRAEGWIPVADDYDDGGFSGGTLERPALQRLMADIEAGRIDIVVAYKIDRLSRSLFDFAELVKIFDKHGVTFVSVTQQFNTTDAMGRMLLNILLTFAQFERELTKQFEEIATLPAQDLLAWLAAQPNRTRGEFVLVIHAAPPAATADTGTRVLQLLLPELPVKTAVRIAAELTGQPRNALYDTALQLKRQMDAADGGDAEDGTD